MMEIQESEIEEIDDDYEFWTDGYDIRVGEDVTDRRKCIELKYSELKDLKSHLHLSKVPSSVRLYHGRYIIYESHRRFHVVEAKKGNEVMNFNVENQYRLSQVEERAVEKRKDYDTKDTVKRFLETRSDFIYRDIVDLEKKNAFSCNVILTKGNNTVDLNLLDVFENEESISNRSMRVEYNEDVGSIVYEFKINADVIKNS